MRDTERQSAVSMDSKNSSSSVTGPPIASNNPDEILMQQSLQFSNNLKDLKNVRKQLYSAAEYFEICYSKEDQKQMLVESLKDYATKSLISTIDHLGSVAHKVNSFLEQKIGEVSAMEFGLCCLEQRLQTCQKYIDLGGLSEQSWTIKTPKHHKRYIFPDPMDAVAHTNPMYHSRNSSLDRSFHQFKNAAHATIKGNSPAFYREGHSTVISPKLSSRQGTFQFTRNSLNDKKAKSEKRSTSPLPFPLIRAGSLLKRSTSPTYVNVRQTYSLEPRRSVSLSRNDDRDRAKDMEQYTGKSKRLFKAMLSMRKSRKDGTLYKYLDEI